MENLNLSQNNGEIEVCGALNYEIKVALVHPSKAQFANYAMVFITNICVSLITIFLNFTTILTLRSSNHLQKKLCHFLIYVQSWNDLGIGLIVSPLYSIIIGSEILDNRKCSVHQIWFGISITSCVFSVIILSAMNIERYLCIVHPFYHRNNATKKKLLAYIFSMCALFTFMFAVFIALAANVLTILFFISLLHFITSVYIYTTIFLVGKAHLKRKGHRINRLNKKIAITKKCATKQFQEDKCRDIQQRTLQNRVPSSVTDEIVSICQDLSLNIQNMQPDNASDLTCNRAKQLGDKVKTAHSATESSGAVNGKLSRQKKVLNNHRRPLANQNDLTNYDAICSLNEQTNYSYNQCGQSDNRYILSDNQFSQSNIPGRQQMENKQMKKGLAFRKSQREILIKFKLAKSCAIVMACFFISFLLPLIFHMLPLSKSDFVIPAAWSITFVYFNATLDSLIFFWRSKILRKEAKKVLKNTWC